MEKILSTDDPPANPDMPNDSRVPPTSALPRWFRLAAAPHIIYPVLAVLVLTAIWGTTLSLIRDERTAAEHTAALSTTTWLKPMKRRCYAHCAKSMRP